MIIDEWKISTSRITTNNSSLREPRKAQQKFMMALRGVYTFRVRFEHNSNAPFLHTYE